MEQHLQSRRTDPDNEAQQIVIQIKKEDMFPETKKDG